MNANIAEQDRRSVEVDRRQASDDRRSSIKQFSSESESAPKPKKEGMKLLSGSAFVFLCRVGGAGLTFVIQVLLARWMGAEQLGIFVFAVAILVVLSQLVTLGYPATTFRFVGEYLAKSELALICGFLRQTTWVILGVSMLLGCTAIPALWFIKGWVSEDQVIPLILIMLGTPVFAFMQRSHGIAHVYSWFKLRFLPEILQPLLFLITVAGLWYSGTQLTAVRVVGTHLLTILVITLGQYFVLKHMLWHKLGGVQAAYHTQEWRRVSPQLLVSVLFTLFFPQLFVIIVGLYVANDQLAIFNSSYRVALLIEFGLTAVFAVVMPKLSPAIVNGDQPAAQRLLSHASLLMFWATVACVTVLFFFGKQILGFLGEEFVAGYDALLIFSAVQLVNASLGPVAGLLTNFGYQDRCLLVFTCAFALTAGLSVVLIPSLGITGAALCVLAMAVFSAVWMYWLVVKHLGIRPSILTAMIGVFHRA